MRRFLRRYVLGRLMLTLGALLGVMQVVIGHWFIVVFAGREGPGVLLGGLLAVLLVTANLTLLPVLRRARRREGVAGVLARFYMSLGIATLIVGFGVVLVWVGAVPVAALLSLAGGSSESLFWMFRVTSALVVFTIAALLLWGFTFGQASFEETHLRVPLHGLAAELDGLRIVQLSDLHIGNGLEGPKLEAFVARVNALGPDVIAMTGDLFDFDPAFLEEGARALAALQARHGVYAVLGNHDTYTGTEEVAAALARFSPGLRLLRGEWARLPLAAPLYLAGIDDPGSVWTAHGLALPELDQLGASRPTDGPTVLLVHRPEAFPQAARLGFPLVLAGHTHGGQLAVPGLGSRLNLARLITRYHRGLFREEGSLLYVNRGAGVAGPALRIGCRREIATIELIA